MKNSRLIELLRSFSKEEIKEFDKFISSPYFGCRKFIIDFFRLLKNYHPEFRETDIDKKKLFALLYKEKKYNDGLMRRMSSEIIKYGMEFLTLKKLDEVKAFKNNCLLMELRDRKLDNFFESKSKQVLSDLEKNKIHGFYELLDKYLTTTELYNYSSMLSRADMFDLLEQAFESMILLFSDTLFNNVDKFLLINYKFNRSITKQFSESSLEDGLFSITGTREEKEFIIFKASYLAYNIIRDKRDEESYVKLKKILYDHKESFSKNRLRTFYSYIFYFYNYYTSRNDNKYIRDEFDTYNLLLKENLFLSYSPYMSIFFCRNYINTCRRVNEYDSIQNFVKKYSGYFIPENKENIINYAMAVMMLAQKNFSRALEYSSKINIDVPQFKMDIKFLRIRCYYELGFDDSLESEIDSLNHFFRNMKKDNPKLLNMGNMENIGKGFLKYVKAIQKLKNNFNIQERNRLIENIKKEPLHLGKDWFLEKLNQLK